MAKRKGTLSSLAEVSTILAVIVGLIWLATMVFGDHNRFRKVTDDLVGKRASSIGPWVTLYHKEDTNNSIGGVTYIGNWYPDGTFNVKVRDDIAYGLTTAFPEIVAEYMDREERKKKFNEIVSSGD